MGSERTTWSNTTERQSLTSWSVMESMPPTCVPSTQPWPFPTTTPSLRWVAWRVDGTDLFLPQILLCIGYAMLWWWVKAVKCGNVHDAIAVSWPFWLWIYQRIKLWLIESELLSVMYDVKCGYVRDAKAVLWPFWLWIYQRIELWLIESELLSVMYDVKCGNVHYAIAVSWPFWLWFYQRIELWLIESELLSVMYDVKCGYVHDAIAVLWPFSLWLYQRIELW